MEATQIYGTRKELAATSALHLAFNYTKLNQPGYLANGLALFGDNAYVSTNYMVTPYKNIGAGVKDDFISFQSQVRIDIDCAFGMLVHCWAILRRALPSMMGVRKQIALTMALCKLHNFCIGAEDHADSLESNASIPSRDKLSIVELESGIPIPTKLLGGGC
jgi:hypothetical protein